MRVVIDASAALAAFTSPDGSRAFEGHELLAPPLLWSEFTSSLHAAFHRGEVTRTTAEAALNLVEVVVRCADDRGSPRRAWALAERLGWGRTYDAEYVALAVDRSLPLLTLDGRLARGVAHVARIVTFADLGL